MTVLGKILVFVVLVLSLIWTGLTVNVFVTRANWQAEAKRWQEAAKASAQAADYQRKVAEQTQTAAAARVANLEAEVKTLIDSRDTATKSAAEANQQLTVKLAAQQAAIPPDQLLQANIARLQKQVDILQASVSTMEKQLNESVITTEKSRADLVRAQIDRDSALKALDDAQTRLLAVQDQINELRTGRTGRTASLAPPEDFKATVTKASGDLVEINLGLNAKLQKGATLSVFRTTPRAKYLGTITVTQVDPFGAVGQFSPPAGVLRPGADDMPKAGDTVGVVK